jgi:hypothetical protein
MSPQKQAAQVSNSAASTGPRTWEGKQRSSQNRLAHGLCSQKYKIAPGDRPDFERHYQELIAELAPVGALENRLAEAIIIDLFRMERTRQLENEIFLQGAMQAKNDFVAGAETWNARCKELALLTMYSQRIHRVLTRNQADLATLQSARKAAQKSAEPPRDSKAGEAAEPSVGFVRSNPSVAAAEMALAAHSEAPASPTPDPGPPIPVLAAA